VILDWRRDWSTLGRNSFGSRRVEGQVYGRVLTARDRRTTLTAEPIRAPDSASHLLLLPPPLSFLSLSMCTQVYTCAVLYSRLAFLSLVLFLSVDHAHLAPPSKSYSIP
jgi:hypothetical protein